VIVTHELSQNRGRKRSSDTPENPYTAGELRDLPITYVRTSGFSMSRPAKRRGWPVLSRRARLSPQLPRRLGKCWWGQVPCGKSCSGGPLGEWDTPRLPVLPAPERGAVSVVEMQLSRSAVRRLPSLARADAALLTRGSVGAIVLCWNGPGCAGALLTRTRHQRLGCPGQVEPGGWATGKYADAHAPPAHHHGLS
jgi:hypothetical protein